MTQTYLTPQQDRAIRRWERWNRNYFVFAFIALVILLVFSSQLGLSSGDSWGPLGVLLAVLVAPIIALQLRLAGETDGPGSVPQLRCFPTRQKPLRSIPAADA